MSKRPNVLLITSDQHHFSCLGSVNAKLQTPALDRLAAEGMRFERAYCNNPVCSPSRSTMITGQYPSWHGCWTIGVKLGEDVPTVGDVFRENGYFTALLGKAHFQPLRSEENQVSLETPDKFRDLAFWRGFTGPWYGFDWVQLNRNHGDEAWAGQHYGLWLEEKGCTSWEDYFAGGGSPKEKLKKRQGAWDLPEELHYSVFVADKTIEAIHKAQADDKPFFAWASFADPHPPYVVPEPWASLYDPNDMTPGSLTPGEHTHNPPHFGETQKTSPDFSHWQESGYGNHGFHSHLTPEEQQKKDLAIYYGMISLMDREIGRILDELDKRGLAEDTLVVFSTDHGHFLGQHGLWYKGAFHYEDLLRLPFLARWPGKIPAGEVSSALQALIDLPETFLDACQIPIPGQMQGVSQLPVWTGAQESARDSVITEFRHQPTKLHLRTFITERYKLTLYRSETFGELFDLQDDPSELHNRFADPSYATVKAQLMEQWLQAEISREPTRFPRIAGA
jgi:arylsulfatase A-like enzyme